MPEDYQAIFEGLGIDTSAADTGNNANADVTNTNADTTATPSTDNATTAATDSNDATGNNADAADTSRATQASSTTTAQQNSTNVAEQRRNDAFAAMRSENNNYKKLVQRLMQGAGYTGSEKEFMQQLENAAYKQEAARQGNQVSPELLKRMDQLESQNKSLLDSQNKQMFVANLKSLQDTFKLNEQDIKDFIDLAVREKIDLTIPGTNFNTLYQGLFFDKLKEKYIEEARQSWIAQGNKASNATNPDGKSGKKDPVPTDVNTMAEFDSLLQSIPKK